MEVLTNSKISTSLGVFVSGFPFCSHMSTWLNVEFLGHFLFSFGLVTVFFFFLFSYTFNALTITYVVKFH